MTSKIIVNTIEADTGISSVTFASNINLQNDSSVLVSSSGIRLGTGSTIAAPSANEIALSTNSAERFRIDSNGNIGIGVNNPSSFNSDGRNLVVGTGSGGQGISIYSANNSYGTIYFADGTSGSELYRGGLLYNHASDFLRFDTAGAERLRITSDGKIGVNNTSPLSDLQVITAGQTEDGTFRIGGSAASLGLVLDYDQSGATVSKITANPTYTNTSSLLKICVDGDANPNQLVLKGDGKVGINETAPDRTLHVNSGATDTALKLESTDAEVSLELTDNTGSSYIGGGGSYLNFYSGGNERLRIDSSGRALIGSPNGSTSQLLQIKGDTGGANNGGTILLQNGVADSSAGNGTGLGGIAFGGATGNQYCRIEGFADGSGGTNDYPGRIVFSTTADAASSPTERMRITSAGYVLKSDTPAFKCKLSGATGANFTGVLVFNSVQYNIGSHYNSSNGRFTAPVDGRYLFAWYTNMERAGGNGSFYADWKINGNNQGNRMYTHHSGAWEQICGTIIFDLNANDYVEINAITSGNWDGGQYGSYSGYLLG